LEDGLAPVLGSNSLEMAGYLVEGFIPRYLHELPGAPWTFASKGS
jgi:PAB1-binding protein PBP1